MKSFFLSLMIIASFVFGLTGCDAATIAKAEKASSKLSSYADRGVNVTRDLYRENIISVSVKDKIADGFIKLADAGIAFDKAIANAKSVYGTNVPAKEIEQLFAVFDSQVVAQFIAVLQSYKLITNSAALGAVIESIKLAVLVIADAFGKKVAVEGRIS